MFQNRHGTAVDPVPFFVVSAFTFLLSFSVGPIYGLSFGLSIELALAASAACCVAAVVGSYYRLVWTARPDLRAEIPASARLERIGYAAVGFGLLLVLISLPFFVP